MAAAFHRDRRGHDISARTPVLRAAGFILVVIGLVLGGVAWALGPSSATTGGADDTTTVTAEATTTVGSADATGTTTQPGSTDTTYGAGNDSTGGTISDTTAPGPTPTTDGAGPTSTTLAGGPTTTLTPANTDLSTKLAGAVRVAGFTVLGSSNPAWRLATVDYGTTSQGPYVATLYIRGTEYFSTSQERGTSYPPMANTESVTVRGQKGDMLDLGHVVVIRWIDGATSAIFSSNLKRDDALKMADSLAPVR